MICALDNPNTSLAQSALNRILEQGQDTPSMLYLVYKMTWRHQKYDTGKEDISQCVRFLTRERHHRSWSSLEVRDNWHRLSCVMRSRGSAPRKDKTGHGLSPASYCNFRWGSLWRIEYPGSLSVCYLVLYSSTNINHIQEYHMHHIDRNWALQNEKYWIVGENMQCFRSWLVNYT